MVICIIFSITIGIEAAAATTTLNAWGENSAGQTNVPAGLANVKAISAGGYHSLALSDTQSADDTTPPTLAVSAEVSHFNSIGSNVDFFINDGATTASLAVYQGASSHYLTYYTSTCSYSGNMYTCNGMSLFGEVATEDLVVKSRTAVLNTNGSGLSGTQFSFECDTTTEECSSSETPIVGAPISVTWNKTSEFIYRRSGTSGSDYVNYKFITNGISAYSSASATGFIFGNPVTAMGSIGTSRSISISVQKNL